MAIIKNTKYGTKDTVKQTLQYSHVPCDAIQDLRNDTILLKNEGEERKKRLTILERNVNGLTKTVNDNNILQNDALGIREKNNGERKKQIQKAFDRISEVKEHTEDEDKSLRQLLVDNQLKLAKIEGLIEGQGIKQTEHDKQETTKLDRKDKYILAILGIIVTVCIFVAGLLIR